MIPYALISLVAATLVIVAAYFLFDVVVKGSYFYLFGATLLFIISALSIGLYMSRQSPTVSKWRFSWRRSFLCCRQ